MRGTSPFLRRLPLVDLLWEGQGSGLDCFPKSGAVSGGFGFKQIV